MSGLKEIRRRIVSVKNTRQITKAMKLVSAAKLKRAEDAAKEGRKYEQNIERSLHSCLAQLPEEFQHPDLAGSELSHEGKERVVLLAGERGLCGAFNTNIIKAVVAEFAGREDQVEFVLIGKRAVAAGRRYGWNVVAEYGGLSEDPTQWPIDEIARMLTRDYRNGISSSVTIYYTKFVSALTQRVSSEPLLPFVRGERETATLQPKLSPGAEVMVDMLIPVAVEAKLRQVMLESRASEHAARMTAMDSATRNAGELIDRLQLHYNRARQAAITKELLDIIGGAEAVR